MGDVNPSFKGLIEIRQYYPPVTPTSSTLQCSQTQCPPKHIFVRIVHVKGLEQIFGCKSKTFQCYQISDRQKSRQKQELGFSHDALQEYNNHNQKHSHNAMRM